MMNDNFSKMNKAFYKSLFLLDNVKYTMENKWKKLILNNKNSFQHALKKVHFQIFSFFIICVCVCVCFNHSWMGLLSSGKKHCMSLYLFLFSSFPFYFLIFGLLLVGEPLS